MAKLNKEQWVEVLAKVKKGDLFDPDPPKLYDTIEALCDFLGELAYRIFESTQDPKNPLIECLDRILKSNMWTPQRETR